MHEINLNQIKLSHESKYEKAFMKNRRKLKWIEKNSKKKVN